MNNNEITITNNFAALKEFDMNEALAQELNGLDSGFERIKIPSAGSTVFEIPGDDLNEPDSVKDFTAVILHHHPLHAYYVDKYTGGNNPPDCGSFDGVNGIGNPGGNCRACPLNKFGTGENGAKACKNRRRIYVLREGEIFPLLLSLPTGSLKDFGRYIKRLLSKGNKSNQVVTKFSLKKATNNSGIAFSVAQFKLDRLLTDEEYDLISPLSNQVKEYSNNLTFNHTEEDGTYIDVETGEIIRPVK